MGSLPLEYKGLAYATRRIDKSSSRIHTLKIKTHTKLDKNRATGKLDYSMGMKYLHLAFKYFAERGGRLHYDQKKTIL